MSQRAAGLEVTSGRIVAVREGRSRGPGNEDPPKPPGPPGLGSTRRYDIGAFSFSGGIVHQCKALGGGFS